MRLTAPILAALLLCLASTPAGAAKTGHPDATNATHVRGYYRHDGTYVRPHERHDSGTGRPRTFRTPSGRGPSARAYGAPRDARGHIQRSEDARRLFMHSHPCPSTGLTYGPCPGYVVDHIRALKHGGADAPSNMQWQTVGEAKAKDKWE